MIATIKEVEPYTTRTGRQVIKLTVLDDTEWKYYIFLAPEAHIHFMNVIREVRALIFSKDKGLGWTVSLKHWKDKILSVEETVIRLGNREIKQLVIIPRFLNRRNRKNRKEKVKEK